MTWAPGAVLTAAQLNANAPQEWSSWTPTITAASGTFTTTSATGRYARHGKTVVWSVSLTLTTAGTAAGALIFTLPVGVAAAACIGTAVEIATGTVCSVSAAAASDTTGRILTYNAGTIIASGRTVRASGVYESV